MRKITVALLASATMLLGAFGLSPASAAAAPTWQVITSPNVSRITPGYSFTYRVVAHNVGDVATDGALDINLPAGVTGVSIGAPFDQPLNTWSCSDPAGAASVHCDLSEVVEPGLTAEQIRFKVTVDSNASGPLATDFQLSGGGAALTTTTNSTNASPTPDFGLKAFDGAVSANPAGDAFTQAGGHPYEASTTFAVKDTIDSTDNRIPDGGQIKNVVVSLPQGFVGSPASAPTCPLGVLFNADQVFNCPEAAQVGVVDLAIAFGSGYDHSSQFNFTPIPLYNLEPPPGVAASFGFTAARVPVFIDAKVSAQGGYHVEVTVRDTAQSLSILESKVTLWGTPADPSHNALRGCKGSNDRGCSSQAPVVPFLTNPTACTPAGQGLITTLKTDSWANPGVYEEASFESHNPPGLTLVNPEGPPPLTPDQWGPPQGPTGCDAIPFTPEIKVEPTSHEAASPTGLNVDLSLPTDGLLNPAGISQANLKKTVVTLPEGMAVNPASASGLGSCAPDQIRLGTDLGLKADEPNCPDNAKIGTVTIDTPLLDESLTGAVYLAKQQDNPFQSLLALYIVVKNPQKGIIVKLAGQVSPDPVTGKLVTTFDDNPQVPFSNLHLELKSGPRAALINPPACGTYQASAQMTPWSNPNGAPVDLSAPLQITSGPGGSACPPNPAPFNPAFDAGSTNPAGGAPSPFVLHLQRSDTEQQLAALTVLPPPGLVAKLAGVPYCPEAALAAAAAKSGFGEQSAPSCPLASQVGSVDTGAGAGPTPFHVQGKAYLAGPYKGAPLSLAIAVPAVAGPFDLGTVVVRSAIYVDPRDAHLTVKSDPLPQILQGIPLDVRSVDVAVDKPNFSINPTNCEEMSVGAQVTGTQGATANLKTPYRLLGCGQLGFAPKLDLKLKGGTKRGDNPALRATVTYPTKGAYANIDRVSVALPHSEFLDQSHIRTVCTRVQFAAEACPAASVYGYAKATTPLLDKPLEGPVYLRSSSNPLPDLVAALHGQIDVDLAGRIDSINGGIRNSFDVVPDAPVSKFTLTMKGGAKGLLENSRNLCAKPAYAVAKFRGQNGKSANQNPQLRNDCGKKSKKAKKSKKRK